MEFTLADESEKSRKELSSAELTKQLDRLIQDKADNQRISDWIEVCAPSLIYVPVIGCLFSDTPSVLQANLDEQQTSSNTFVRALMMSICQSVVICESPPLLSFLH